MLTTLASGRWSSEKRSPADGCTDGVTEWWIDGVRIWASIHAPIAAVTETLPSGVEIMRAKVEHLDVYPFHGKEAARSGLSRLFYRIVPRHVFRNTVCGRIRRILLNPEPGGRGVSTGSRRTRPAVQRSCRLSTVGCGRAAGLLLSVLRPITLLRSIASPLLGPLLAASPPP